MAPLTNAAIFAKNNPENTEPFLWLYEIKIPGILTTDPAEPLRLTSFDRSVEFGFDDAGAPLLWSPAPVDNTGFRVTKEGDLPVSKLSVGFSGYNMLADIDARDGLTDAPVEMRLLNINDLSDVDAGAIFVGEVMSCSATTKGVQLEISAPSMLRRQFPRKLYGRRICGRVFGDGGCGYDKDAPGAAFSTCGNTLTDCEARGADEKARGFVVLHPRRFNAQPGIPRATR